MIWGRGVTPPGGFLLLGEGQKKGKKGILRRRRRREKILNSFLEIFGKFVNIDDVKSDVGVVLVEISRKFQKMPILGEKLLLPTAKNFESLLQRHRDSPPKKSPWCLLW